MKKYLRLLVAVVMGYAVLHCNLSDITYFGFHTSYENYTISVNDLI